MSRKMRAKMGEPLRLVGYSPKYQDSYNAGHSEGIESDCPNIPDSIPVGSQQAFEFARGFFAGQRKRIEAMRRKRAGGGQG